MSTRIAGVEMEYNDARQAAQLLGITPRKLVDAVVVPGFRPTLALTAEEQMHTRRGPTTTRTSPPARRR